MKVVTVEVLAVKMFSALTKGLGTKLARRTRPCRWMKLNVGELKLEALMSEALWLLRMLHPPKRAPVRGFAVRV